MNKVTTCCKARYTSYYDVIKTSIIEGHKCQKCHKSCTLEDVPAESWEERAKLIIGITSTTETSEQYEKRILDFIKSELKRRDRELVEVCCNDCKNKILYKYEDTKEHISKHTLLD